MKICTVVGIKGTQVKNKKGEDKIAYNYYLTEPFSQYDVENSVRSDGFKTLTEFSYIDFGVKIGDKVVPYYDRMTFNGQERAVLSDFIPAK